MKREAPAPGSIIIPAATLAEFIARAVESYGTIRSAARGIGVPFSTLRGWRRGRYLMEPTPERNGDALFQHVAGLGREIVAVSEHVAALRSGLEAANENVAALRAHLDEIERMTGRH
jgi:transposase-like protein